MANSLRIVTWNANGLVRRKLELESFLREEKIDVMLISETHFTNLTVFRIYGYQTYSIEHSSNKTRGGTAMIIRNSIQHHSLPSFQQDFLQASLIHIETKNFNLVLAAIYCPPRYTLNHTRVVSFFTQLGNRFIAGGNFNSKHTQWDSRLTTPRARQLLQALNSTHTSFISTGKPTHWPADTAKRPDQLDFFLIKGIPAIQMMVEENIDLSSDHIPLLLRTTAYS